MSITAILVTHNSAHVIEDSLKRLTDNYHITECIVVDNASTDSTASVISVFPTVTFIENKVNIGFGAACNQALEKIRTDFALLINPDAMLDAQSISQLHSELSAHPNAAMAGPLLTLPSQEPIVNAKTKRVEFLSGAAMLWRMEHMRKVGFFDAAFFLFYEDDDICLRTRKAGYDLLLVPAAQTKHEPGTSCEMTDELSSLKLRSSIWSSLYFTRKHRGRLATYAKAFFLFVHSLATLALSAALNPHKREQKLASAVKAAKTKLEAVNAKHLEAWKNARLLHEGCKQSAMNQSGQAPDLSAEWKETEALLEKEWRPKVTLAEKQFAAATRAMDKYVVAMRRKREAEDTLGVVRHFLSSPQRFRYD